MSKPDARRKYDDDLKREAVRLVKDGMPKADVARKLLIHPKAVDRAVNEEKEREAGGSTTDCGKRKKAAAKPLMPMEDIADSDGVPRVHRPAVQDLDLDAQGYMELVKVEQGKALEDSKAFADEKLGNLKHAVYHACMAAIFNSRLRPVLSAGGESEVEEAPGDSHSDGSGLKPGDVLRGIVFADEPDEVFVALPVGGGVIDKRNHSPAWQAPPKQGGDVRVRINGFDSKRGLWDLRLVGQQTAAPAPGAIADGLDRDERRHPSADLASHEAGPEKTGVTE
jgi:transposase-like protein